MYMNRRSWSPCCRRLNIDNHIPPALYIAVAELLAWLYRVEQQGSKEAAPSPTLPPSQPY